MLTMTSWRTGLGEGGEIELEGVEDDLGLKNPRKKSKIHWKPRRESAKKNSRNSRKTIH